MEDAFRGLTPEQQSSISNKLGADCMTADSLRVVLQGQDSRSGAVELLTSHVKLGYLTASILATAAWPGATASDNASTRLPCSQNRVHTEAARAACSSSSGELRH
jgi:hypothetical protein